MGNNSEPRVSFERRSMFRATAFALAGSLVFACLVQNRNPSQGRTNVVKSDRLEGVYEFVSESTTLTKPEKTILNRTSSEWAGRWHFQGGYFSQTLMRRGERDGICDPQKQDSIGYESFAGTYKIDGNVIELTWEFALSPLVVGRSILLQYHVEGNTLILVEKIHQNVHSIHEGIRTTMLRRVR